MRREGRERYDWIEKEIKTFRGTVETVQPGRFIARPLKEKPGAVEFPSKQKQRLLIFFNEKDNTEKRCTAQGRKETT